MGRCAQPRLELANAFGVLTALQNFPGSRTNVDSCPRCKCGLGQLFVERSQNSVVENPFHFADLRPVSGKDLRPRFGKS